MDKLLVICGPTATGKTGLGIRLAKKFNGEIISADSRQVYQGMDLATGKDLPSKAKLQTSGKTQKAGIGFYLFEQVPVWMLDIVKPNYAFSVADYHEIVHGIIENVWRRGKLPILLGGTGLYIKAMVDGIGTLGIPPDPKLRAAYAKKTAQELYEILFHLDPETANHLNHDECQNRRRLIRKIEIAQTGKNKKHQVEWPVLDVLLVGLTTSYPVLYERIDKRIDDWVKKGAEAEVRRLLKLGYTWDLPAMSAIGYRQWQLYFEGKATLAETVARWKYDEHAYARRQMTWFKKALRPPKADQGYWFDISKKDWEKKVEKLVTSWYTKRQDVKKN